jgi:hypothetical protein
MIAAVARKVIKYHFPQRMGFCSSCCFDKAVITARGWSGALNLVSRIDRLLPLLFDRNRTWRSSPLAKTDLGPAAKSLVEKIASATGTLYAPLGTILQAYADASADKIKAVGKVEVELARRRALERLAAEETKKQNNLEAIHGKTFQLLDSKVGSETIEQMDEDWIVFHSEKARLVSDHEMQTLWARIMASEAEVPGSYSKRALEMLSVLEKTEAHLFTSVCKFIVRQNSVPIPVILYDERHRCLPSIYTDHGLDTDALLHLATIGLVHYSSPLHTSNIRLYNKVDTRLDGPFRTAASR